MTCVPAVLLHAAAHLKRGREYAVYVSLFEVLDFVEYRTPAAWFVGQKLGLPARSVRRAMQRITAAGYLDREPGPSVVPRYRLLLSPRVASPSPAPALTLHAERKRAA